MALDINELRRLVQDATPGPWKMLPVGDGRQKFAVADSEFLSILTVTDEGGGTFGTVYDDDDAKFIAAANPAAISELLDRLEAAEKSDAESIAMYRKARDERDALRAKITEMEQQVPICRAEDLRHAESLLPSLGLKPEDKLYTLPGAQSVPDGWKLMPIEPTPEMLGAGEDTFVPTYTGTPVSAPIDVYRAMLSAAPEAKP